MGNEAANGGGRGRKALSLLTRPGDGDVHWRTAGKNKKTGWILRAADIIRAKRDGLELSPDQIRWFVEGATSGVVEDYQAAAFLMAVFFRGMTPVETSAMTGAMRDSGRVVRFDLSSIPVDKHSTGGVGDKVSISLAPLVAACGAAVPMVSGRGLGHTGGTLDKLEAIPGFNVNLSLDRFRELTEKIGACLIGQTEEFCPADRLFYSLRDVTSTVESLPLIVSSILSKKTAEGIGGLVMDVKTGSGAFMKTPEASRELARALCDTGRELGLRVHALVTDMNQPLGRAVGNALETAEAVDFLKGESESRYREITFVLASHMLVLSGVCGDLGEARTRAEKAVADGTALDKCREIIETQGGDPGVIRDAGLLPTAKTIVPFAAPRSGFLDAVDTMKSGQASMALGGGRERAADEIDPAVGFIIEKKLGEEVREGEPLLLIHANDERKLSVAEKILEGAFTIGPERREPAPLIRETLTSD